MTTDIDAAMKDLVYLWTFAYVRESTVQGLITPAWTGDVRVDTVFIHIETVIVRVTTVKKPC
jgi:hypothetical protein